MKNIHFLFALLITTALFQSCQKEPILNDEFAKTAPTLPAAQSFIMPMEAFENADSMPTPDGGVEERAGKENFVIAAINVFVWQTVLNVTMAVPVASFGEAFNHAAEPIGNNTYQWEYNVLVGGKRHDCVLTGEVLNADEDVRWTMTVSQRNGFQDVVWYTGVTSNQGMNAEWTLNHQPNNPENFLKIEYSSNGTDDFDIRYTNIEPTSNDAGDFIEFRTEPADYLNRAYDIFDVRDDNLLEIQWNEPNGDGRLKNLDHFGDDAWHCWDTDQEDTNC